MSLYSPSSPARAFLKSLMFSVSLRAASAFFLQSGIMEFLILQYVSYWSSLTVQRPSGAAVRFRHDRTQQHIIPRSLGRTKENQGRTKEKKKNERQNGLVKAGRELRGAG